MGDIKIVKLNEVNVQPLPGIKRKEGWEKAGWVKRIIYPPNVITKGIFFGVSEINPGYSPHGWHTHFMKDLAKGETKKRRKVKCGERSMSLF